MESTIYPAHPAPLRGLHTASYCTKNERATRRTSFVENSTFWTTGFSGGLPSLNPLYGCTGKSMYVRFSSNVNSNMTFFNGKDP